MACPANLADTLQINNPGCSRLHQCVVSTLTASLGSADAHRLHIDHLYIEHPRAPEWPTGWSASFSAMTRAAPVVDLVLTPMPAGRSRRLRWPERAGHGNRRVGARSGQHRDAIRRRLDPLPSRGHLLLAW